MKKLVWARAFIVQDQVEAWACWSTVLEAIMAYYLGKAIHTSSWVPTYKTIEDDYKRAGGVGNQQGSANNLPLALETTGHFGGYFPVGWSDPGKRLQRDHVNTLWNLI